MTDELQRLLADGPVVIAVGVHDFAESVRAQGAEVIEVDWRPPATTDPRIAELLNKLL